MNEDTKCPDCNNSGWNEGMGAGFECEACGGTGEAPETSETPGGHLRWCESPEWSPLPKLRRLQQLWYITTYRGLEVEQREEWRDVPVVSEPL